MGEGGEGAKGLNRGGFIFIFYFSEGNPKENYPLGPQC